MKARHDHPIGDAIAAALYATIVPEHILMHPRMWEALAHEPDSRDRCRMEQFDASFLNVPINIDHRHGHTGFAFTSFYTAQSRGATPMQLYDRTGRFIRLDNLWHSITYKSDDWKRP